jgi:hypothetical protein
MESITGSETGLTGCLLKQRARNAATVSRKSGTESGVGPEQLAQSLPTNIECPAVNPGQVGQTTQVVNAFVNPGWKTTYAYFSALSSLKAARTHFPGLLSWNDQGDAFRHFRWSFSMTTVLGAESAASYANSHEVSNPNPPAETAMHLHNNAVGRAVGADPRYSDLTPDQAAKLALGSGCLQIGLK